MNERGDESAGVHLPIFVILLIPCYRLLGKRRCKLAKTLDLDMYGDVIWV